MSNLIVGTFLVAWGILVMLPMTIIYVRRGGKVPAAVSAAIGTLDIIVGIVNLTQVS